MDYMHYSDSLHHANKQLLIVSQRYRDTNKQNRADYNGNDSMHKF